MELLEYSTEDLMNVGTWNGKELSRFDTLLRTKWDKAMSEGHFRYQLDKVETKIIPGSKKYVAQLNVKRATERRKPQQITTVNQDFDSNQFNFTKIKKPEILFSIQKKNEESSQCNDKVENLVIVNVSPLEYGHVLVVPDVNGMRPQLLTEYSIRVATECMLLSSHPGFRIGFNSLCAYASVNHLHFHAYYLEYQLFVETCPVSHLEGPLYELDAMPCKGFAFQLHGNDVSTLCSTIHKVAHYLREHEIAHNLYITKGTVFGEDPSSDNRTLRFYLWPRKKVVDFDNNAPLVFVPGFPEFAGHFTIRVEELFADLTEESIEMTLAEEQLDETEYLSVKKDVIQLMHS